MGGIASKGQLRMSFLRWAMVTVPAVLLLGFLSGQGTKGEIGSWYAALDKPGWTPPNWAFPVAWTLLYLMLGLALAVILNARGAKGRAAGVALFVAQFVLNLAWTPVFFGAHDLRLALIIIAAMIGFTIGTVMAFRRVRPLAAALMIPYLLWIVYAAALNWSVLQRNPDADKLVPGATSTQVIG